MNMRSIASALAAAALFAAGPALAHEGHDHAAELPPLPVQAAGPRLEARSADLELLAVLKDRQLVIYLDHFASNVPITDAKLELESGNWSAQAQARPDGSYVVDAAPLAAPGSHPVVITVEAGDIVDLLNGELQVGAPQPPAGPAAEQAGVVPRSGWVLGGLAALAVFGVLVMRMRRSA